MDSSLLGIIRACPSVHITAVKYARVNVMFGRELDRCAAIGLILSGKPRWRCRGQSSYHTFRRNRWVGGVISLCAIVSTVLAEGIVRDPGATARSPTVVPKDNYPMSMSLFGSQSCRLLFRLCHHMVTLRLINELLSMSHLRQVVSILCTYQSVRRFCRTSGSSPDNWP